NKPVISNKNSIQWGKYLTTSKSIKKSRELINEISPKPPENFFLTNTSKKNNQAETNQQLALTANKREKITEKEQILLAKIKQLEEQLKQVQAENGNLTVKLTQTENEKSKLELTAIQEKKRADYYEQQLKTTSQLLHQWQKNNYYQQLEQGTESKIIQLPLNKPKIN
ncbi:16952_t:CDS:1, partial [Cetraspora pellucida]